jgi:hypothetical protein
MHREIESGMAEFLGEYEKKPRMDAEQRGFWRAEFYDIRVDPRPSAAE